MNKRTLRVLEYYKIIELLTSFATTPSGKRMCERLKPKTDIVEIEREQQETEDALARVYQHGSVSFSGVYPISDTLKRAEVGADLSIRELLDIAKLLKVAENARQYGEKAESKDEAGVTGRQDSLTAYFESLITLEHLSKEINRCIISEDEIADDASSALKEIRRDMKQVNNKVHEVLSRIVARQENQSMLQDAIVTMRNGRYCIPVKAEYKGQFPGMVHDQSGTGSTLFIEPMWLILIMS